MPAGPKPGSQDGELAVPADLQQDAAWVAAFLGMSVAEVERWLAPNLNYDPGA